MADRSKRPPGEALVDLRRRLALLSLRDPARTEVIAHAAEAYGVSVWTIYRALRELTQPKSVRRSDHGSIRTVTAAGMERYAEIIAALKIRTSNEKGRHLSTARAIRLIEEDGVETPDGLVRAPAGLLKRATVDRVLRASGLDHARVTRPIAAVRFQAKRSNELWQFDMSPSDMKQVEAPLWIEPGRGKPTLMLFSAVDDRSGVVYDEYRCVYGEDAESALRFLFNAMAPKPEAELPFQGIPAAIYMDNGPVSRSKVFQSVMGSLGVRVLTHMPPSEAERRTPARSKGKVERPFRTIKEVHETLYHFHKPKDEAEANLWMRRALVTYNNGDHRAEPHSRVEDWLRHLPANGIRTMCSWERFCAFAREPERRTSLPSLIEAMFYDLTPGDRSKVKIPKQPERRERDLRDLMRKHKHPVVLIVDEAHELHHKTLSGFKRLMELAASADVVLSVLLIGHPKLRNDLRRPQMEEVGYRTTLFEFEGVSGHRREFIAWLLKACAEDGTKPADLMDDDAIELLSERLRTALQIEMHLALAFEQAFRLDERRVSVEVVEQVLSRAIDDLEPTLTRNGYDAPALTGLLNAKPAEIRDFLAGTLNADRTREFTEQLRVAGVPV